MNITHVCLCGPVTDFFSYQDNLLSKYHAKLNHKVTLITSEWVWSKEGRLEKNRGKQYINDDNVKIIRLKIKGNDKFEKKFKIYKNFYKTLELSKPEIIFIHGSQFLNIFTIIRFLKKNKNVIVYVDNHADFSNSATNWLSINILHKIIWRITTQKILPFTKMFYGVLPSRVDFLKNIYRVPDNKVELLLMGIDDEKMEQSLKNYSKKDYRKKLNLSNDDFVILTGGKIDNSKKQIFNLISAVKEIKQKNVKLLIFGSVAKELKDEFFRSIDSKKIIFIGFINDEESFKMIDIADLVIFPGRHSVYWEQVVGQGTPLIVKYWEGSTHVDLGGNVKFLYKDNKDEIKNIIYSLLENKEDYEIMKNSAKKIEIENFKYSNIAKKSIM